MTINYPNGVSPSNHHLSSQKKQGVNGHNQTTFANRGMSFEEDINQSNDHYQQRKIALIHKKPTPIQIVKVDYPRRSQAVIREAYFRQASTTDYSGVYHGYHLDFEAKETKNKTAFPLSNFHAHQLEHMKACLEQKGIAFVLLWFSSLTRCFFLSAEILLDYWEKQETGRKSIPFTAIESQGIEIFLGVSPRVPYLKALDEHIKKENQNL